MATDASLVVRVQQGDGDAFTDLAMGIGPRLLGIAFSILRDRLLAEDATQQALVQVWRKAPRLRDPARFDAWAYRIVVRECYALTRQRRRLSSVENLRHDCEPVSPDVFGRVTDRDRLERGFERLSMDHRVVLVLHHYLDLTLDETAAVLRIPVGTVRSRLHYAMRALRAGLDADERIDRPPTPLSQGVTR